MEKFHKLRTLDEYLENIESYLGACSTDCGREVFLSHIHSMPNVADKFNELAKQDSSWIELASKVDPQFLVEKIKVKEKEKLRPDQLTLCIFNTGTQPAIKLYIYDLSL